MRSALILISLFFLHTNRGRDGSKYQAERFVVLQDERQGSVAVEGTGFYPNPKP